MGTVEGWEQMNQFKELVGGRDLTPITFTGRCPTDLQVFHVVYARRRMDDGTVMFDTTDPYGVPRHRECVRELSRSRGAYGQVRISDDEDI